MACGLALTCKALGAASLGCIEVCKCASREVLCQGHRWWLELISGLQRKPREAVSGSREGQ